MGTDFYKARIVPHAGIIIKICRAYTNNKDDFEDYYQEVCLQIWRSRERFKQQCTWTTWIYKVSLNVCMTNLKKQANTRLSFTSDPLPEEAIEDSRCNLEEELKALYKGIHQLSEVDRALILLHLEKQSNGQIADILGLTANNVGVRLLRIKQRLNRILNYTEVAHE